MQTSLQNWQGVRLIVNEDGNLSDSRLCLNLFWIKKGYLFYCLGSVHGETSARAMRILHEWLPIKEVHQLALKDLVGAEEVFFVDPDRTIAKNIFRRKSYSIMELLLEKIFGMNLKKKFAATLPILPVRQINSVQIGNSRLLAKRLAAELKPVKA